VTSEIGQVGTQFDGFAHQSHGDSHYNCFKTSEIATRSGFTKLGVQNAPTFFARGVMLDVAALKGVEMLGDTYEITVADLQQALERQKLKLLPGDAVIIHTGWGKLYGKDNARFVKSTRAWRGSGRMAREAGSAARGSDNWPVEVALIRQGPEPAGAPDLPGGERHPHPREPEARRAVAKRVYEFRVHHAAAQDLRRFGLVGGSRSHPLIRGRRLAGRPAGWLANEEICHELLANNVAILVLSVFCLSAAANEDREDKNDREARHHRDASPALIQARQKFFGLENVDDRGRVDKDKVIFSWATNTTYAVSFGTRLTAR